MAPSTSRTQALYRMTHKPDLGIKSPYELNERSYKASLQLSRHSASWSAAIGRCLYRDRRFQAKALSRRARGHSRSTC